MSLDFEYQQRLIREKERDNSPGEKWWIKEIKNQHKEIKYNTKEREQSLKIQKRINLYNDYNQTKEPTVRDFDNLYTSYRDYMSSEKVPLNQKLVAHRFNYGRKYEDEPYYISYKQIADDLAKFGHSTTEQAVGRAVRQLIDIGLFYKKKTSYKNKLDMTIESLHINFKRLKILTESHLIGIYANLKGTERTVANWPFVICKYDLTDKEKYRAFIYQMHIKINGVEAANKALRNKPKSLLTAKEVATNRLKNDDRNSKNRLKDKKTTLTKK